MITLPKTKNEGRIGILGGSFDPPHLGHQILALCALALEEIDEVWVVPCADHPFSKKLSSFAHRMNMAKLAFELFGSRVHVVGIEEELPGPSYSFKTLEAIKKENATLQLSLIMGSDVFLDLSKWKCPERIAELSRIIVFLREGAPIADDHLSIVQAKKYDQFILPHVKSTDIREIFKSGAFESAFVDRSVCNYAIENKLYLR